MVDFGHNYFHAMDKSPLEKVDLSTKDVGISMGIGDPWANIKASVSAGASTVELGFMGMGKGSISSPTGVTPETLGTDKREDIRMFAKLNDIKLSTHAAAGITGVTGLSREGRGFSDMAAQNTVLEIERAIDFAADTAGGGAVVFHVGEFPRDVTQFKDFRPKYGDWEKEEVASLVNKETGQLVQFQKGQVLLEPVWERNKNNQLIDGEGKVISKDERFSKGVPKYDKDGKVTFQEKRWHDFELEAKEYNSKHDKKTTAAKLSFIASQRAEVDRSAPFAFSYMREYENGMETIKDLERIKKDVAELEDSMPKDKQFILKNNIKNERYFAARGLEVPENQSPTAFVDEQLREAKVAAQRKKEGFIGYSQQLEQIDKMQNEIVSIEEYGIKRSAKKMAEVAMHAYQVTKDKELKKAVFIAPENLFPETGFGSHPQELKKIILQSRKEMRKLLKDKGMNEGDAKNLSEKHIKATFDIAHANTWRKYFNKSDKEFDKWMENQVDDLVKSNVIGHVHLSDNFGYYDEHLAPGQGNAPIGKFLEKLQKSGKFKGHIITEPGAQGEGENIFSGMLGSWAQIASSPIYRVGVTSKTWSDIEGSYFGRTFTPNVISGQYHISPQGEDNWWSGTPIE